MSTTLIITLVIFAVLGFGAYRAWAVWNERFADRSMREQEREMALFAELKQAQTEAPETIMVMDPPIQARKPAARTAAPVVPAIPPKRDSTAIIDAAGRVVFFSLKIALPDHEILARVDTAALITGGETPPPRAMLDFVVCRRDFTPVAVIVLLRGEDPLRERAAKLLEQSGLHVLRWEITSVTT